MNKSMSWAAALVAVVFIAAIAVSVSYGTYLETQRMKACVESGKSWVANSPESIRESSHMECR